MRYKDMLSAAEEVGAVKDLVPTYFPFDKKGDSFIGSFKGRNLVSSSVGKGDYYQYLFDTDDGLIKCAMGQASDRDVGALLEVGGVYVVTFNGQVKIAGGKKVNKFSVKKIETEALESLEEETPPEE